MPKKSKHLQQVPRREHWETRKPAIWWWALGMPKYAIQSRTSSTSTSAIILLDRKRCSRAPIADIVAGSCRDLFSNLKQRLWWENPVAKLLVWQWLWHASLSLSLTVGHVWIHIQQFQHRIKLGSLSFLLMGILSPVPPVARQGPSKLMSKLRHLHLAPPVGGCHI